MSETENELTVGDTDESLVLDKLKTLFRTAHNAEAGLDAALDDGEEPPPQQVTRFYLNTILSLSILEPKILNTLSK